MLNQKFIIVPLAFAGKYNGNDADLKTSITSQVVKTCNSLDEAETFVRDPLNKGKALIILPAFEMPNNLYNYLLTNNTNKMNKADIAEIAYSINRVYDAANDNIPVPAWDELPDAERQENIKMVQFYLDHPSITGPEVHEQWLRTKANEGWGYGANYDLEHKLDPMILDYPNLPVAKKFKYHLFPQVVSILKKRLDVLPKFVNEEPQAVGTAPMKNITAPAELIVDIGPTKDGTPAPDLLDLKKESTGSAPDLLDIKNTSEQLAGPGPIASDPAATPITPAGNSERTGMGDNIV